MYRNSMTVFPILPVSDMSRRVIEPCYEFISAHVVEVEECLIGWGSVNVLYYHNNIIIALVDVVIL